MRHLPSIHDDMRDVSTYELEDGRRVTISNKMVRELGAAEVVHQMGLGPKPSALAAKPVYWLGQIVGTLLGSFDPRNIRSRSFLYVPRPGDFMSDGDGWRAAESLGLGDIEAVEGFVPPPPPSS